MEKIKNYFRTAFVYFVGNVFSKLIVLFLLPLYTNRLAPAIMGEFDYAVTLLSFISPICFFQIWDAMFRFSFDYEDENKKNKVISNTFMVTFCGIVIYSVVYWILQRIVGFKFAILVYAYGLVIALNYLYSYLARVYRKNILFSVTGFINSLVVAICNIVLIVNYNMGLESLYISAIGGALVQCIMIGICLHPLSAISLEEFDTVLVKNMIKFSIPLCVATISYWLLSGYTKVLIVHYLGTKENGLYAVTNKFAMLINMIVSIFQFAWNEMAYVYNKDNNRGKMYSFMTKYIIHYVLFASCGLMIVSKLLFPLIIGPSYQKAIVFLPAAVIGVGINAIAGFLGTIFSTEKITKYIFWSTFYAAIINIVLGVLFTKMYGLQGAMIALAISFLVLFIIRLICLKKVIGVNMYMSQCWLSLVLILTIVIFYVNKSTVVDILFIVLLIGVEIITNSDFYIKCISCFRKGDKHD